MSRIHYWIGLDVGEKVTACCILDDQGRVVEEQSVPTRAADLRALLKPVRARTRMIAIEAGSIGTHLARSLIRQGYPVSQFDARQAHKFLSIAQNKTDKNDARGLAEIGRIGRDVVSKVLLKTIETQNLRSTLATRQKMIQLRVALEGMMRSLFQLNGGHLESASSSHTLHRNVTRELSRLRKAEKVDLREEIEPILKLSQGVRTYVETLDERLKAIAADNPVCQRFMKVPGIGPICALSFYSSVEEPSRFHRNADVGAYLGLTPRVKQSGSSASRLRITRAGSRMTRAHLVMAAGNCLRNGNSSIGDWGIALRERIGGGKARVAMARKLAVLLLAIWKSGREYEPRPSNMSRPAEAPSGEEAGWETEAEPGTETILLGHLAQPAKLATTEGQITVPDGCSPLL